MAGKQAKDKPENQQQENKPPIQQAAQRVNLENTEQQRSNQPTDEQLLEARRLLEEHGLSVLNPEDEVEYVPGQLTEAQLAEAKELFMAEFNEGRDEENDAPAPNKDGTVFFVSAPLSALFLEGVSVVEPLIEIIVSELQVKDLLNAEKMAERFDSVPDRLANVVSRYAATAEKFNIPLDKIELVFSDVDHDKTLQSINLMRMISGQPETMFYPAMVS